MPFSPDGPVVNFEIPMAERKSVGYAPFDTHSGLLHYRSLDRSLLVR